MRMDAHQHYWTIERGDYGWLTPELKPIFRDFGPADLKPLLATGRISKTILVQAAPSEAETQFLLDLARTEESIAGVIGWTDFTHPDAVAQITRLATNPLLVGLRPMIQDIPDPDWMLGSRVAAAFATMVQCGLVFDALVKPLHLRALFMLARCYPELSIVIDHGAKPNIADHVMSPWDKDMASLAQCPNVCVKLSGLMTEAGPAPERERIVEYASYLLATFGPQRVLFGSDWPVLNLASDYPTWLGLVEELVSGLPEEARGAVMGLNAQRVYLNRKGSNAC